MTDNAIAPAVIQTPMVEALPQAQIDYMTKQIPMARTCTLKEVAEMASFVLSSECSFTTGFTFDLTGGRAVYWLSQTARNKKLAKPETLLCRRATLARVVDRHDPASTARDAL